MLFISRRIPEFVVKHGGKTVIQTNAGNEVIVNKPVTLRFEKSPAPLHSAKLPGSKYQKFAQGQLDTHREAERWKRMSAGVVDADGEDITEKTIIDWLFKNPSYGIDFIAMSDDGREISDTMMIPEGDGGFFCRACEKHLANAQAKEGHIATSKEHAKNIEQFRR